MLGARARVRVHVCIFGSRPRACVRFCIQLNAFRSTGSAFTSAAVLLAALLLVAMATPDALLLVAMATPDTQFKGLRHCRRPPIFHCLRLVAQRCQVCKVASIFQATILFRMTSHVYLFWIKWARIGGTMISNRSECSGEPARRRIHRKIRPKCSKTPPWRRPGTTLRPGL